jgi:farnesyl diphosphate synthase
MAENEEKTVVKTETKKNERLAEFDEFYASKLKPRLLDRYKDEVECIRKTIERFDRMLDYNVPHGKKNRGLCVYESYLGLLDKNSTNCPDDLANRESRIEQAKALGWCIEFVREIFFLILF